MKQYLDLLKKIMDEGTDRPDRTGVGSRAIFGQSMRFNMKDGFPAMTTKKLAFGVVKAELLWFLSGSSDNRELQKMGAHIELEGMVAKIKGVDTLYGAQLIAPDIRASAALVIAGIAAQGTSTMSGIHHLLRGYQDLCGTLQKLGARITVKSEVI